MASRRNSAHRFWIFIFGFALVCLFAGWVVGAMLGGHTLPRIPFLYHTPRGDEVAAMSRESLEREVRRLREDLAARNRELDDLKIQVKLLSEGSHTGK